jgi:hypothetical protein
MQKLWILLAIPLIALLALALPSDAKDDLIRRTGVVGAWFINDEGKVYLRVDILTQAGTSDATWFVTPGSKGEFLQFEHMVIASILDVREEPSKPPELITCTGDPMNQRHGRDPDHAVLLRTIGQRRQ